MFEQDGFVREAGVLQSAEMAVLLHAFAVDQAIHKRAHGVDDGQFEAEPGDVMFFHSNTLHTSAPNWSDVDRHLLLVADNTRANDPYLEHHHPRGHPIDELAESEILARADRHDGEKRLFLNAADDRNIAGFETLAVS